jgi:hypothetical protein
MTRVDSVEGRMLLFTLKTPYCKSFFANNNKNETNTVLPTGKNLGKTYTTFLFCTFVILVV